MLITFALGVVAALVVGVIVAFAFVALLTIADRLVTRATRPAQLPTPAAPTDSTRP